MLKEDKKVFLVGKNILKFLSEPVELYEKKIVKSSQCAKCLFKDSGNKFAHEYCNSFCNNRNITVEVPKYRDKLYIYRPIQFKKATINPSIIKNFRLKKLNEKKTTYMTPLQSKVMLSYLYLSNNKGIINLLPKIELAKLIGCSPKSIDSCNNALSKYKLISYQMNSNNELTIVINNFSNQYATKNDGGLGYVVLATSLFKELLNINKLHEMRIALKAILLFDANNNFGNRTSFSIDKLKEFLPKYKQKNNCIKNFIDNIFKLFKNNLGIEVSTFMGTELCFSINEQYEGKSLRTSLLSEYTNIFKQNIEDKTIPIKSSDEKAKLLAQLSLEYDYSKVLKVFNETPMDILIEDISKLGKFIRYFLEQPLKLGKVFFSVI